MKKKYKGFTLVEMLIVIVIIGILAAALIPRLTGAQDQARDTARLADLNQLGTSLTLFNADNASYPRVNWTATGASAALVSLVPTYIKSIPTDPRTVQTVVLASRTGAAGQYMYQTIAAGFNFVLAANTEVSKKGNITATSNTGITTGATFQTVQGLILPGSSFDSSTDTYFIYVN